MPPGGRDCWLPHDSGAGLCWQHVGGVGSTTTTTTTTWKKLVEEESVKVALKMEDALCRSNWSDGIIQISDGLR